MEQNPNSVKLRSDQAKRVSSKASGQGTDVNSERTKLRQSRTKPIVTETTRTARVDRKTASKSSAIRTAISRLPGGCLTSKWLTLRQRCRLARILLRVPPRSSIPTDAAKKTSLEIQRFRDCPADGGWRRVRRARRMRNTMQSRGQVWPTGSRVSRVHVLYACRLFSPRPAVLLRQGKPHDGLFNISAAFSGTDACSRGLGGNRQIQTASLIAPPKCREAFGRVRDGFAHAMRTRQRSLAWRFAENGRGRCSLMSLRPLARGLALPD